MGSGLELHTRRLSWITCWILGRYDSKASWLNTLANTCEGGWNGDGLALAPGAVRWGHQRVG